MTSDSATRHDEGHYDVAEATGVYAGMAGVLSGFAFVALLLLFRDPPPDCSSARCQYLLGRAVVALIVGFIGCGIAGFAFGVVASAPAPGQSRRSPAPSMKVPLL